MLIAVCCCIAYSHRELVSTASKMSILFVLSGVCLWAGIVSVVVVEM